MPALPIGTITFLFTDIEGSTTRWEKYPQEMAAALALHDALIQQIVEAHEGVVFKTVGDAFYVVFTSVWQASVAAIEVQKALQQCQWPASVRPLLVRMALHTGEAQIRGFDYFGQALNRTARILSAGHGGQILLSLPTIELLRNCLPPEVSLKDLGVHRLKDIRAPEHIFQMTCAGLMVAFPALKTLELCPNNLPTHLNGFVGRQKEVQAIRTLLRSDDVRLLTLIGPAGVGKTRLAIQVATGLSDLFPGGIYVVDLATTRNKDGVLTALAQAIGLNEENYQSILERLQGYLRDQTLLLFDTVEQISDVAPFFSELLHSLHQVKLLLTSRISLHLQGGYEYMVAPLPVPDHKHMLNIAAVEQSDAVTLFVQHARMVKPDFVLTPTNMRPIAEICAYLDGLPLAIELAAARVKLLSPQALVKRLGHRFQLLSNESTGHGARQQTLWEAIAWSYNLLNPYEKELFTQLSVFSARFTLEAAEAICLIDDQHKTLDGLHSLVDKSLLRLEVQENGETSFEMLYTIREYALEQLSEPAQASIQLRHMRYYLEQVELIRVPVKKLEHQHWLYQIEAEYDNIAAALSWSYTHGYIEESFRITEALWQFWWLRGLLREGRKWFEALFAHPDSASVSPALRAKALQRLSLIFCINNRYSAAMGFAEEALMISQQLADKKLMSDAYVACASVALRLGEQQRAVTLLEESLKLRQALNDIPGMASLLNNLGNVARQQEKIERAMALHRKSLFYFRQLGEEMAVAAVLNNLAEVEWCSGYHTQAVVTYEESLLISRKLGYTWGIASSLAGLADAAFAEEMYEKAREMYKESLHLFQEMDDQQGISVCIEGLTQIIRQRAQTEEQPEVIGYSMSDQVDDTTLALLRQEIGEELFTHLQLARPDTALQQTLLDAFTGMS
ncbi:MAG: tetratricopeptide repeat protein [Ktedonobacteraceae bacterium]|nr:tetratricopeptide repeat protein [Ktedonobacteraceae bacterium]